MERQVEEKTVNRQTGRGIDKRTDKQKEGERQRDVCIGRQLDLQMDVLHDRQANGHKRYKIERQTDRKKE